MNQNVQVITDIIRGVIDFIINLLSYKLSKMFFHRQKAEKKSAFEKITEKNI